MFNGDVCVFMHTAILTKWKSIFAYIPIESQIEKFQEEYDQSIAVCLVSGCSDEFIEFIFRQIDHILDEISKETFRKHYLNPAMKMHLVEMTVPDKPTSRNQRYYKI